MERIKGGFPPLVLVKKQGQKPEQKEMKKQFFAEAIKKNVNIKELLTSNSTFINLDTELKLKVVENF